MTAAKNRDATAATTPAHVVAVHRIAPHMLRVRLAADGLHRFATPDNLHVRLHLPDIGDAARPIVRYYTIRRIDPDAGWLDIDFVLHDRPGPGAGFALRARPGDTCAISGPCGRGVKPASRYLLAGDEAALPAIARILEELDRGASGHALIEVAGPEARVDLRPPPGVSVTWLYRHGTPPGASPLLIAHTARALADFIGPEVSAANEDAAPVFAWIAVEYGAWLELRPLLAPLHKSRHLCVAYWQAIEE